MLEKMVEAGEGFYGHVAVACGVQVFFPIIVFIAVMRAATGNEDHGGNGSIRRGDYQRT